MPGSREREVLVRVYRRTAGGVVTYVSQSEGLAEIGAAQMSCEGVREMSQINRTDFAIDYLRVGEVRLELTDQDWAGTATGSTEHRFDDDGRARCNRRIRAYDRPMSQHDRRVRWGRHELDPDDICPKCDAL